ncbi:MAG: diacylglycerol/lipid kinase family protein [Dehalococcoidia bacterium]
MTKRARLIANPAARTLPSRDRLVIAPAWLRLHGWEVDSFRSESSAHATALAREAAEQGYDAVIAAGGDGTVNDVVNGIAGTETALAVIPGGTANVWSRETGTPSHPGSVAAMLEGGRRARIDLGLAGERYFLLMTSLGLDSAVVAMVTGAAKSRHGRLAYIARGLQEALHYRGVDAEITADGETWRMPLLVALLGNTRSYGGLISISNRAHAADGLLDLVTYRAAGVAPFALDLARTAVGRHAGKGGTRYRHVREAFITTTPAVPVQADGEIVGSTPMRFTIVPRALTVILPPDRRPPALEEKGGEERR